MKKISRKKLRIWSVLAVVLVATSGCELTQEYWGKLMAYGTRNLEPDTSTATLEQEFLETTREVSKAIDLLREQKRLQQELIERLIVQNMYGEAIVHIEELLAQTPENGRLHYLYALSMVTYEKNMSETRFDEQKIQFHYERALALEPTNYSYAYAYAVYLIYEKERYSDALDVCNTLLALHSKDPRGYFLLARTYYGLGNNRAAIEAYENIVRLSAASEEQKVQARLNIEQIRGER